MRSPKNGTRRRYRLRARAERQEETHRALARAAFELHNTVGPSQTTVSAIAKRAGVQRLTVYRHFPTDEAIFSACTAVSFALDPPPNPEAWIAITDPMERLRTALSQLFGYYGRRRQLLSNLYRDSEMPVVAAALARRRAALQRGVEILTAAWPAGALKLRLLRATIGHVLEYSTWLSLTYEQGLDNDEAIELAASWVAAALSRA
jgi:AcrR family transcriptional regulator